MVFPSVGQVRDQCFSAIVPPRCKVRCCSLSLGQPINNPPIYTLRADFVRYKCEEDKKTLPKAQRTRGLSSYHKITVHKSWTYYSYRISLKHQLQNLNQTSSSRLNLKLKSWPNLASEYCPRFNFVTSTKHQQQKTDQTSATRLNFNFKIWT